MAKVMRWKLVPAAEMLKVGDRVVHYEELMGADDDHRKVRGWFEHAVVVQVINHADHQDCLIAAVGDDDGNFYPSEFTEENTPYFLRYYNTSLVKEK